MSQLQPYPEYKESGAEWLGRVPAEWDVLRIKMSVQTARNGIWGQDPQDGDFPVWCVRVADFDRTLHSVKASERTMRSITSDELISRKLNRGDLLLEKSGGGENNPVGFVVRFDHDDVAVCSNFVAKMQLSPGMDPRFWTYVHATTYSVRLTQRSVKQTSGIQNLDQASYFNELAPFPPLDTQSQIADFLERETAQIDELIGKQERLIELLAEKRQAIITNAVTKGLDPTAPTMPSGAPWLGEVPEHWEVVGSRRIFRERGERARMDDEQLTSSQVHGILSQASFVAMTGNRVTSVIKGEEILKHVEPDDFVISMRSFQGGLELSRVRGKISSAYVMLVPNQPKFVEYFRWLFKCDRYISGLQSTSNLVRDGQALRFANFAQLRLPVPPVEEQKAIAAWIEEKLAAMEKLHTRERKASVSYVSAAPPSSPLP